MQAIVVWPMHLTADVKSAPWEPLLEGEERKLAHNIVREIAEDLTPLRTLDLTDAQLLADIAMFFRYASVGLEDSAFLRLSDEFSEESFKQLCTGGVALSRHSCIARIAWVNEHLSGGQCWNDYGGKGAESDDGNDEVNKLLIELVSETPWTGHYDLFGGLVGYATYFSEGLPAADSKRALGVVVRRLEELCEESDTEATWHTPARLVPAAYRGDFPSGYYDLGIAHGVPGILVVLATAAAAAVETKIASRLANALVVWIRARMQSKVACGSFFPARYLSGNRPQRSRHAWCYGDPGLAIAWLRAAELLKNEEWKSEALHVLSESVPTPLEASGVKDAGLCHGTAGLAQIYNRVYQSTRRHSFREGARYWLQKTIDFQESGGFGGYRAFRPQTGLGVPNGHSLVDATFLEGSIGIGLALLAGSSSLVPGWDRRLLISVTPSLAVL